MLPVLGGISGSKRTMCNSAFMRLHDADAWRHSQGVSHADLFDTPMAHDEGETFSPIGNAQ